MAFVVYLFTRNNISAHVFVNSVVMIIIVVVLFMLNKYPPPPLCLSINCISAIYVIYLVHMKVLDLMVANWGHISLLNWLLVTIIVTIIVNRIKIILNI